MLNETYIKKVTSLVKSEKTEDGVIEGVIILTNTLKEDIAQAIKEKAQSGGGVDFIDVPTAIEIVSMGGIPTTREKLELLRDCLVEGDNEDALKIVNEVLG